MKAARRLLLALLLPLSAAAQQVPGVRAEYFNYASSVVTPSFPSGAATVDRVEDNIAVYNSNVAPASGIGASYFLTRYTGYIRIPAMGKYDFQIEADDGVRLYFDCNGNGSFQPSETLVNAWIDQSNTTYVGSCSGNLSAGSLLRFQLEYYQRSTTQTVRLSWRGPSPVGATFVVVPKGDGTQGLYSGIPDAVTPSITGASLVCGGGTQMTVGFSKPMQVALAQTAANYSLSGGHTVTSATISRDGKSVALTFSPALTATRTLTVNNLIDTSGLALPSGSSTSVSSNAGALSPGLLGTYYGQGGIQRAYFTGATTTRTDTTVDFGWGSGATGVAGIGADDFSVRWTGLIQIPTTGSYQFRTVSDDGVRLYLNGSLVIDNWTDHAPTTNTTATMTMAAGALVPITLEYYERGGGAVMRLQWLPPGAGSFVAIPAGQLFTCNAVTLARFSIATGASASTCAPQPVTVTAVDGSGATLGGYTGSIDLGTSTGRGDWTLDSGPAPSGSLVPGAANTGTARYTFAAGDAGAVRLRLTHSLAQTLTVSAVDTTSSSTLSTSSTVSFSDNAFVWSEDTGNLVMGNFVAVAGRNHDMRVTLIKRDPNTGSCGTATDFSGIRNLKLWRTDTSGPWTAPTVAGTTILTARPSSANVSLAFTAGVANFDLTTTDVGRYSFNLDDDSLAYASGTVSGSSADLTVRPFTLVIAGISLGGTANPNGSAATDAKFGAAGSPFSATIGAYRWSSTADSGNDGIPDAGATFAQTTAGGLTPGFNATLTLSPVAGSQTPSGGVLGSLANASISGFTGGRVTVGNLAYSEVGSFLLRTSGLVTSYLGTAGVDLNALVFNAGGSQNARVGRFVPARFVASAGSVAHRAALTCSPASTFSYLGENFRLAFTLTAQNASGATTQNYSGAFAKFDPTVASAYQLVGRDGSSVFSTAASRLALGTAAGSWSAGVADVTLTAQALRAATPDGPFNAAFGIAPQDSDGVTLASFDMASASGGTNDRATLASVALRLGRMRLANAIGAHTRALALPVVAQSWNGTAFEPNALDSCTSVAATAVSFGNRRRTLTAADTAVVGAGVNLTAGIGRLVLAAPQGGRSGSVDVALSLGSTPTDASCLQPWSPAPAASTGASLAFLRGAWCSTTYDKDPAARATWGLYRGADSVLYQRENY